MAGTVVTSASGRRQVQDQPVPLHRRVGAQGETLRDLPGGMRRDGDAGTADTKPDSVVRASDALAATGAQRQRYAAVRADVVGDHDGVAGAVDDQRFVKQGGPDRCGRDLAGHGDRVPVPGQDRPVGRVEGAISRQRGGAGTRDVSHGHGWASRVRKGTDGV